MSTMGTSRTDLTNGGTFIILNTEKGPALCVGLFQCAERVYRDILPRSDSALLLFCWPA